MQVNKYVHFSNYFFNCFGYNTKCFWAQMLAIKGYEGNWGFQ